MLKLAKISQILGLPPPDSDGEVNDGNVHEADGNTDFMNRDPPQSVSASTSDGEKVGNESIYENIPISNTTLPTKAVAKAAVAIDSVDLETCQNTGLNNRIPSKYVPSSGSYGEKVGNESISDNITFSARPIPNKPVTKMGVTDFASAEYTSRPDCDSFKLSSAAKSVGESVSENSILSASSLLKPQTPDETEKLPMKTNVTVELPTDENRDSSFSEVHDDRETVIVEQNSQAVESTQIEPQLAKSNNFFNPKSGKRTGFNVNDVAVKCDSSDDTHDELDQPLNEKTPDSSTVAECNNDDPRLSATVLAVGAGIVAITAYKLLNR